MSTVTPWAVKASDLGADLGLSEGVTPLKRLLGVKSWNLEGVSKWITKLASVQRSPMDEQVLACADIFREHLIGGEELVQLTEEHCKEMGIKKVGVRLCLMAGRNGLLVPHRTFRPKSYLQGLWAFATGSVLKTSQKDVAGLRDNLLREYDNVALLSALIVSIILAIAASNTHFLFESVEGEAEQQLRYEVFLTALGVSFLLLGVAMLLAVYGSILHNLPNDDIEFRCYMELVGDGVAWPLRLMLLGIIVALFATFWGFFYAISTVSFAVFTALGFPVLLFLAHYLTKWTRMVYQTKTNITTTDLQLHTISCFQT